MKGFKHIVKWKKSKLYNIYYIILSNIIYAYMHIMKETFS